MPDSKYDKHFAFMPTAERLDIDLIGITRTGKHEFNTTGVLGVSNDGSGAPTVRGFPSWRRYPVQAGCRWGVAGTSSLHVSS